MLLPLALCTFTYTVPDTWDMPLPPLLSACMFSTLPQFPQEAPASPPSTAHPSPLLHAPSGTCLSPTLPQLLCSPYPRTLRSPRPLPSSPPRPEHPHKRPLTHHSLQPRVWPTVGASRACIAQDRGDTWAPVHPCPPGTPGDNRPQTLGDVTCG